MHNKLLVGWRETLSLPELGIDAINAKVDTGAKTSCLHTFRLEPYYQEEQLWIRFWIHPKQHDVNTVIQCQAPVVDQRIVRDSGGHEELRYVIATQICLGEFCWQTEFTLTNRENMAFRMLLGRRAMHKRIIVDPSQSFLISTQAPKS